MRDFFINYGFVSRTLQASCIRAPIAASPPKTACPGPRRGASGRTPCWNSCASAASSTLQEIDDHFSHGKVKNYWGGNSNATTHLLDAMHYQGLLRVVRREAGIRMYTAHQHAPGPADDAARRARIDALVDAAVHVYAPLPAPSLRFLVRRLRFATPQWQKELTSAVRRAHERLCHATVDGTDWFWPADEDPTGVVLRRTPCACWPHLSP